MCESILIRKMLKTKNPVINSICGVQKFNKVIMSRVIPKAEEAMTVPRSPYTQMVKLERRAIATSRARYQRGGHTVEEELQRGG